MKKHILTLLLIASHIALIAQTEINFQINHKLGDSDFEFDTEAENDLGNAFDVTRIEYYISEITLYHDAGTETNVEDLWILADGDATTNVSLGDHDITLVDSISFSIGVEFDVNHDDPSTYANGHPLGFQNPSMHWGWAAGYRFVAMEGNSGSSLNDLFQIHALGDNNYHSQTQVVNAAASDNQLTIELDADYEKALSNVSVDGGLINHGENGEAADLLENFRDLVFAPAGTQVGMDEFHAVNIQFYPNPVNANAYITFKGNEQIERVVLMDLSGRTVQEWTEVKDQIQLGSHLAGTYILSIYTNDGGFANNKVILQ